MPIDDPTHNITTMFNTGMFNYLSKALNFILIFHPNSLSRLEFHLRTFDEYFWPCQLRSPSVCLKILLRRNIKLSSAALLALARIQTVSWIVYQWLCLSSLLLRFKGMAFEVSGKSSFWSRMYF